MYTRWPKPMRRKGSFLSCTDTHVQTQGCECVRLHRSAQRRRNRPHPLHQPRCAPPADACAPPPTFARLTIVGMDSTPPRRSISWSICCRGRAGRQGQHSRVRETTGCAARYKTTGCRHGTAGGTRGVRLPASPPFTPGRAPSPLTVLLSTYLEHSLVSAAVRGAPQGSNAGCHARKGVGLQEGGGGGGGGARERGAAQPAAAHTQAGAVSAAALWHAGMGCRTKAVHTRP